MTQPMDALVPHISFEQARSRHEEREFWTEAQMKRLLEKERFRSGRREIPFAFSVWSPSHTSPGDPGLWSRFCVEAARTMRLTDEIGVWEQGIAILLTDTDLAGAEIACEKLRQRVVELEMAVAYELYVYPDEGRRDSSDDDSHARGLDTLPHSSAIQAAGDSSESTAARRDSRESAKPVAIRRVDLLFERPTRGAKRAFDVIASTLALVVLAPVLLLVAIAVKLTSRGPVIFTQLREGRGGRVFKMYKFRTMVVNAEALQDQLRVHSEQDGPAFKMTNDPRLTSIGRILRKTCVDELPQLLNILRGEMSVVGPRPLPVKESQGCTTWQRRRLDVTPGLTCSWQAEAARQVTFDDWMRLDLRYARCPRLAEDLRLILRTVTTLLRAKASV